MPEAIGAPVGQTTRPSTGSAPFGATPVTVTAVAPDGGSPKPMDRNAVQAVLNGAMGALAGCLQEGAPGSATVTVNFELSPYGKAMNIAIEGATGPSESCVRAKVLGLTFPAFDGKPEKMSLPITVYRQGNPAASAAPSAEPSPTATATPSPSPSNSPFGVPVVAPNASTAPATSPGPTQPPLFMPPTGVQPSGTAPAPAPGGTAPAATPSAPPVFLKP